jgi:hypothetical protein
LGGVSFAEKYNQCIQAATLMKNPLASLPFTPQPVFFPMLFLDDIVTERLLQTSRQLGSLCVFLINFSLPEVLKW